MKANDCTHATTKNCHRKGLIVICIAVIFGCTYVIWRISTLYQKCKQQNSALAIQGDVQCETDGAWWANLKLPAIAEPSLPASLPFRKVAHRP